MEIIDLSDEYEETYCRCLEDWSDEMHEAGDLKNRWLEKKKKQGLRVKLARNHKHEIVGMIQFIPENLEEWGLADAIFINDRMISTGPPPSYEKLRKILKKRMMNH